MRCPYCGCMSDGCGFCSVEGWEKDVVGMEEPTTVNYNPKENERSSPDYRPDYYDFFRDLLDYCPKDIK